MNSNIMFFFYVFVNLLFTSYHNEVDSNGKPFKALVFITTLFSSIVP